jgi:hypothetical protein
MTKWILAVAAAALLSACVLPGIPGMGDQKPMTPEEAKATSAQLNAAQAQGQAAAVRPGDDKLDCAALQAEMMALMNDPSFKAALGNMTGNAQTAANQQKAAQAKGSATPAEIEAARKTQAKMLDGANMAAMMPNAMRAQRVTELGKAKKCPFAQGM